MMMQRMEVNTQQARLEVRTHNAELTIRQPKAEQRIAQPPADVTIRQRPGKLSIDQTTAWHNLQFYSSAERTDLAADFGHQDWMKGLGRVAREGDELMRIENQGNPIAAHAKQNAVWEIAYNPGSKPVHDLVNVTYEARPAEIDVKRNDPVITTTAKPPEFSYQPGRVDISMAQYPRVTIDWKI
ncbi:DUF6470 family protein [Salimicrobium salexigens]|uniref:Uncharacterized protein n=1 Tax=Salimicrobium salexigens TaxID=908941 RepID=A0ABY1KRZ5_9BACI|nr:DUF6470 family protein [Salimicrobium salexigens]SIS70310.1 hypothetical protein SAMN05421758_10496 [Salimicrobium salexigens]